VAQELQLIEYRELTLPRINLQRSLQKEEGSLPKSEKQETIRHSKSNLVKTEIPYKIANKGKIVESSPVKSTIEAIIERKKSINLRAHLGKHPKPILYTEKKKRVEPRRNSQKRQPIIGVPSPEKPNESWDRDVDNPHHKKSPEKMSKIQKMFQEDEAFPTTLSNSSEANFDTSNDSFRKNHDAHPTSVEARFSKWEPSAEPIRENISGRKQTLERQEKATEKQGRTILSKENMVKKIKPPEGKVELELIYDEMVGCYYHPSTQTYYEIKE
jgi:hypothetical protein